jgi:hypothetical protein
MMGPEAALVSARIADLRRLGGYAGPDAPKMGPMYAEVAARVHLEPFWAAEAPGRRAGVWARFRAAVRRPAARRAELGAGWTVAAAPIVAQDARAAKARAEREAGLLAGLPLLALAQDPK